MKLTIVWIMTAIIIGACNGKPKDVQADPRSVAEAIFDAAKSGNCQGLAALVDTEADSDSKRIAQASADKASQEEFQKYFAKGKVSADPVISGDKASVNILFGPDGTREETFEMTRKEGKWYLTSF
ncbi:hypothetical protein D3H65_21250 [Paraflavitalea soli]|uniref:DUF4878 domain-containing protein n=2 Tax=Paraflavitalea soli TaxID=2315862 RepID=A0A3B7MTR6_9BACT|nr:hypothetical protein D3H65_21250 [Paraflavitalea soli]